MVHGAKEGEVSGPQGWEEIVRRFLFRLEKNRLEGMERAEWGRGLV